MTLTEIAKVEAGALPERAEVPAAPGQRGIDVALLGGDAFVVLLDGGGPRYLAGDAEGATEVWMTAQTLRAHGSVIAVGCGAFGQKLPKVELYDLELAKTRSIDLPTRKTAVTPTRIPVPRQRRLA